MKKTLTVFTPAYNRAHIIGRTYESLCRQTCKDFEWLVIDDGSSDNTRDLVTGWIKEEKIPIRYIYQENQGMHGAHNTAYKNITTELNTCIDSDDWMPDDAVEIIVNFWQEYGSKDVAGIIGLDVVAGGTIIGTAFEKSAQLKHSSDPSIKGDKKLVIRSELTSRYPEYPIFPGERYVGLGYKYQLIDQDYMWLTLNEPLVVVEYQEDGSSYNMYRQWWKNPQGFAFIHNNDLKYINSPKRRLQVAIHYVSHCIRAKSICKIFKSNAPILTTCCIPLGVCLYILTAYKVWKGSQMKQIK